MRKTKAPRLLAFFHIGLLSWKLNNTDAWKFRFPRRHKDADGLPPTAQETFATSDPLSTKPSPILASTSILPPESPVLLEGVETIAPGITNAVNEAAATAEERIHRLMTGVPAIARYMYDKFLGIVLYKPPVGIVTLFVSLRLVLSGRIFHLYREPDKNSVEGMMQQESRQRERRRYAGRSYQLDEDDMQYASYGGMERVRRRLCWAALEGVLSSKSNEQEGVEQGRPAAESLSKEEEVIHAIVQILSLSNIPGGSRAVHVQDMLAPLGRLEQLTTTGSSLSFRKLPLSFSSRRIDLTPEQIARLVKYGTTTGQVRAMDAFLRLSRDRLLRTSYRLARTHEHWTRRVKSTRGMSRFLQKFFRDTIEDDRLRLSYAEAAYKAEVQRLGQVATVLLERPKDMDESFLLQALQNTNDIHKQKKLDLLAEHDSTFGKLLSRLSAPRLSRYSFRWRADGKFGFSVQKLASDGQLEGQSAADAILSDASNDEWNEEAVLWTRHARRVICNVVQESLQNSSQTKPFTAEEFQDFESEWGQVRYAQDTNIEDHWNRAFRYVNELDSWRRVGEGKAVRFRDSVFVDLTRRLNIMGIPSTLLWIWSARYVHHKLMPHWPHIRQETTIVFNKVVEILHTRVWVPFKGIVDDIMNKNPGIMSAYNVEEEQVSLDHMLRDMGFGDGTSNGRKQALQMATDQYEDDLRTGLLGNLFRGRLVRLLLVQVQQLKVGTLSALETIDVLMQGNRIHFQLLAAIPAIFIASYGTKIFFRSLYNIRAQDIRPVTAVHSEMARYLSQIENILLLSNRIEVNEGKRLTQLGRRGEPTSTALWKIELDTRELGEVMLNMHRYLILLDFTSPPLPTWACDVVHGSLREMLGPQGTIKTMGFERQQHWISLTKQKHQDLLKHL